jgi:quercetin dioxygenase-like cupin family protein
MARTKIIDITSVVGVKVFCEDLPATELTDQPLTVEAEFAPGAQSGRHIHPNQVETFEVISGTLDILFEASWRHIPAGQSVSIPRGTVHAFRNSSATPVRALNIHKPGLRTQEYWEQMEKLIRDRRITGTTGLRNGIYLSMHVTQFRRELILLTPPDWFLRMLARLGAGLGFRLS